MSDIAYQTSGNLVFGKLISVFCLSSITILFGLLPIAMYNDYYIVRSLEKALIL